MFEDGSKLNIFAMGAIAFLAAMALEQLSPRADLATAVDTATLPMLPVSARPDGSPAQTEIASMRVALGDGFEARLLYGYVLEGRVVTRREFRNDPTSAVSPLDLGIVWGELAEPDVVETMGFRALRRAVRYWPGPETVLPANWEEQVTNNHLVPASQAINDALMAVEVGDNVRISGYLVVVTGDSIRPWRSSTRRNDNTIIGGCEIILVTGVEVLGGDEKAA